MLSFTDQTGQPITLPSAPQRIISLVPSITELLADLGLEKEVVGITKFCIKPPYWFRSKNRIGGTKNLDLKKIKDLHPDLIIANKEENTREQVEELKKEFAVWVTDINNLEEAIEMIDSIGQVTNKIEEARKISGSINDAFKTLARKQTTHKVIYLIWKDPYMTVGGDTFIHDMLSKAGFQNLYGSAKRYPTLTIEDIKGSQCDVLLLSSEPFPFKLKHQLELQKMLPNTKIMLVDGEMFSWYGSRLLHAPNYFSGLQTTLNS